MLACLIGFILLWLSITHCQLNLYNTDRVITNDQLQFDCLYYYSRQTNTENHDSSKSVFQIINFCLRPINQVDAMITTFENTRDQQFTLYELRQLNVTVEQLLSWSAPIDLIEKYVFYINQSDTNNLLSTETFYNCTKPWLGTQCQYSFGLGMTMSLDNIIRTILQEKFLNDQISEIVQNFTCYTHIKCYRGSSLICLDWREICNGHIDCIDEGNDENRCFELKINQCDENEYRCDNGLCIPKDFWRDDGNNPECLDGSDELKTDTNNYMEHCLKDPTFRCEDLSCSLKVNEFTCGDGRCTTYDGKDKEEDLASIPFQNICNGDLDQQIKLIDGRHHSDETDCEY
ncbi:unnamed protein product [Rotaria sp. Silwood1]|nr:unnamed protein product [Rotaria sp. Silwood1]CAF1576131.1 unnamed protein product [Rotaria sp. Silwood1]CAF3676322.1 unnamed protein product [Rotaria sp. Silwood1]CAF3681017.1 unnamed protein product [Rotaria sp. Silwood1]CAF4895271.1 unnamed protein product [Rotaria sp. Silwood1]